MARKGDRATDPLFVVGGTGGTTGATETTLQDVKTLLQQIEDNTDGLELKADTVILNTDQLEAKLDTLIAKDYATETTLGLLKTRADLLATEATLTSILGAVDGVEALLTTIRDNADGVEGKLDTVIGHVDGIESALATLNGTDFATETTLGLIKAKTDNLDVLLSTRATAAAQVHHFADGRAGAARKEATHQGQTASFLHYTVTSTKTLKCRLIINVRNTSTITAGIVHIRNGTTAAGAIVATITIGTAVAGSIAPEKNLVLGSDAFPEHFTTGIFIELNAGTCVVDAHMVGEEEAT